MSQKNQVAGHRGLLVIDSVERIESIVRSIETTVDAVEALVSGHELVEHQAAQLRRSRSVSAISWNCITEQFADLEAEHGIACRQRAGARLIAFAPAAALPRFAHR